MKTRATLTGLGMYVPETVVTNHDLEQKVATSDEWIRERTGIRQRHIVSNGQATSDLSVRAVEKALEQAGATPQELDLIVVATITPDMFFPSTACVLQEKIGATNAWGFDLSGACSGFIYALATGTQFIENGIYRKALVVGTDVMSSIVDFEDRQTCVLFGDGAGAVVLEPTDREGIGILDFLLHSDGTGGKYLKMPAGGSRNPASLETIRDRLHYVHQEGRNVYKFAVKLMTEVSQKLLDRNNLKAEDLRLFVPHQANLRIINSSVQRLNLRPEQVLVNIDRYANTTAATIPMGLVEAHQAGRLQPGDLVLLASFGAGFTWGAVLLRWGLESV